MGVYHLMGLGRSPGAITGPLSYLAHRYQRWNTADQQFFGRFGALDVGVKHDGLVHISQLSDGYVSNVGEIVHVGQQVRVKVLIVERQKGEWRINLTIKGVE